MSISGYSETKGINEATAERYCLANDQPVTSFKVRRPLGLMKNEEWLASITPSSVQFFLPQSNKQITISKETANAHIQFPREFTFFPSGMVHIRHERELYKFILDKADWSRLFGWLPKKAASDLKNELRKWGLGLIALGFIHLVLTNFLDPIWGVLIIVIGALNLLIHRRGMFIVNGIVLLLAGVMNMAAGGGWKFFGMIQIVWGVQEIRKLREYE
ncbi:MAG: hypothetical protein NT178_10830 [Proteobacteria bacterium]|nr:hypothetical protein [Pseudomonadota bacterium]